MNKLRRIMAALLTFVMITSTLLVPAFAANEMTDAEKIAHLGLLKGDSADGLTEEYLAKKSTRMQMAILYARWLGFEEEAYGFKDWDKSENFSDFDVDTSENEQNMLAYYNFYEELGFVGTGNNMFSTQEVATNKQFAKIILTAMGYPYDEKYDWEDILMFAAKLGINMGNTETELTNSGIVSALLQALEAKTVDDETFAQFLLERKIITEKALNEVGINFKGLEKVETPSVLEIKSVKADNFSELEITFNQPIDKTTVTKDCVRIDDNKLAGDDKIYVVEEYGNGAIIRVYGAERFVGAQNEKRTLQVTGIQSSTGIVMNTFSKEIMFRDSAPPTVEKIVGKGNTRIDVHFSEPIASTSKGIAVLATYQINERSISAAKPELNLDKDENTGRILTIKNIRTTLVPGEYSLGIFGSDNNIMDTAGNSMGYQSVKFTITEDTEGPIAQKVLEPVYPNKVKIEFDEEITDDATITWTENSKTYTSEPADVEGKVATFEFKGDTNSKLLPFSPVAITLKGTKDYSGNAAQTPLSFTVTAVSESDRPTVVEYGSDKEGEVYIKFNKQIVLNTGTWTVKNSDDDKEYSYTESFDPKDDKLLFLKGVSFDKAGKYTITVKGVKDTAKPTANELLEVTFDVTVPDTVAPGLSSAYFTGTDGKIVNIYFSEKIEYASAVLRGNYQYSKDGNAYSSLPTTAKVELLSGERLVRITFSEDLGIKSVKVTDVEDEAGNKASALTMAVDPALAVITGYTVKATEAGKIEIQLDSGELPYFDSSNFTLINAVNGDAINGLTVRTADLSSDGKKVTLNLSKNLDANATYKGSKVFIRIENNEIETAAGAAREVIDEIKPGLEAWYYSSDESYEWKVPNSIILVFNEEVKGNPGWGTVFHELSIDGKRYANDGTNEFAWDIIPDSTPKDGKFAICITFSAGTIDYKKVTVNYTPGTTSDISDLPGNECEAFNQTIEDVKYPQS